MRKRHLPVISTLVHYYGVYRPYVGKRIYIVALLALLAALLEGVGLAFFMPLLSEGSLNANGGGRGISRLLSGVYAALGLPVNHLTTALFIIAIFTLKGFVKFAEGTYNAYLTTRIVYRGMRKKLISEFFAMSYRYYIAQNTGTLTNTITHEVDRCIRSFRFFSMILVQVTTILALLLYLIAISWEITLAASGYGLLMLIIFKPLSTLSKKFSLKYSREHGNFQSLLIQAFHSFKYLRSTQSQTQFTQKTSGTVDTLSDFSYRIHRAGAILKALAEPLVVYFIVILIAVYAGVLERPVGEITVNILLLFRLMMNVMGFQSTWQQYSSLIGGVDTVFRTLRKVQQKPERNGTTPVQHLTQGIALENITFSYEEKPVLQQVSLSIPHNRTIALVGESGSGKSTLIDILTGVLKPQGGSIYVDGIPGHEVDYTVFRERIGYVAQENVVFDDTVANNISLWTCDDAETDCMARVREAARQAHCEDFIEAMSEGYQTEIGDRGIKLSGGQRQRLAIARELYRKPDLLLLDEATSALDSESEQKIQESIDGLKGKMTVVIIAHRLSTIKNADYIYVLDQGRVIEHGSFQDLIENADTKFKKMVEMQSMGRV